MNKNILICVGFSLLFLQSAAAETNNPSFLLNMKTNSSSNSAIYIQIFKQEGVLELYQKLPNGKFNLSKTYPICKFSGGLGPKKVEGDLKSPEGFYQITANQLNPNSRYYRSINLGFPNEYDRAQGYQGNYLMIHGDCVSVGCYAMTDKYMSEIYQAVEVAFRNGQSTIDVSIYPFKMTKENMLLHRNSSHYAFWQQLKPAYDYFQDTGKPAQISVTSGKYAVNSLPETSDKLLRLRSQYALAEMK
ncbi:L,D-transpeptidase family protein [Providencia manganoxydans]|uniref:Murein L,D-transpeptidase n=1 Tax=Providencia manganoxydans TaxID=2923283 RepID=A0ABX7AH70_9GAMM|nr:MULTISPECIES: murein L,D-transpeptidase family protein [Providencia]ELR5038513.1 murein L,D-transpeptidase [Providencia stuartii]ELR5084115.1 murein L,D-transpeptidase [Providencia stuartii]ELR5084682.1 murein L,D-transpeptidase [Providencia stuartii]MDX4945398.1 murein L,D-transpeptidase family protein [Providencia manganoxydans]QQO63288.1 murein L,D-transpeptidase [Providencia manganoxydans]